MNRDIDSGEVFDRFRSNDTPIVSIFILILSLVPINFHSDLSEIALCTVWYIEAAVLDG